MERLPTILLSNASGSQRGKGGERGIDGQETDRVVERSPQIGHRRIRLTARVRGEFVPKGAGEGDGALSGRINERTESCDAPRMIAPHEPLLCFGLRICRVDVELRFERRESRAGDGSERGRLRDDSL